MQKLELNRKYQALLAQAQIRQLSDTDVEGMELCFQTLSLAAAIDRDCSALLAPHGLSEGRFVLLFLLEAAGGPLAPHTLAEQAGITRASVTSLLDGLEREALIQRKADQHDRRALIIELTPTGRALAGTLVAQHSRWIASLFAPLSPNERKQFARLLGKVGRHLSTSA